MRKYILILTASVQLLFSGCGANPQYVPTATLRDLMDSVLDPNADFLWESVATIITAKGVDKRAPHTDEEWKAVRNHAITLVEATNLLLVPNRHVAKPGEAAANPDFERGPMQIEAMIAGDRSAYEARVRSLREAAMTSLAAIEAKDVTALENSGETLDKACEACHELYWYREE